MIQFMEHNHSGHELSLEDLLVMHHYSLACEHYQQHRDYYLSRSYGLPVEDASWWASSNFSIRWTDIHADSYGVSLGTAFELCQFKYPVLASKVITQHLTALWSLKRLTLFLLIQGRELDEFITEAQERKYPWNYIKSILDEYAEIHSEYWYGASITKFTELSYYRPHTVISDSGELDAFCQQAMDTNPKSVEDYRKGKTAAVKFLVGQVMKLSKGKADAKTVGELLEKKLKV
jgi:Asp-tRNA(Asn)/Glu-tRNA(Gln) amidotransferase B subunit